MADSVKIKITGDDSDFRSKMSGLGGIAKAGAAAVAAALGTVGTLGVKYDAQMESYQTSFEVMLGSASEASDLLAQMKKKAAETPFELTDIASATQLLMNYGLTAEDAMGTFSMLGDISQGNADKLNRVATAYGQMSSAGKVQLEDVKQMIEAGYNPLQEISQTTGESMASLYARITAGTLSVDEITASMQRSTSEGGKYFESMDKQSETLSGRFSTLKDNAMSALGGLFQPLADSLRDEIIPAVSDFLANLDTDKIIKNIKTAVSTIIDVVKTGTPIVLGLVAAWKAFEFTAWIGKIGGMGSALKLLNAKTLGLIATKAKDKIMTLQLNAMYAKDAILKGASTVKTVALTVAQKAAAAGQWLLNAAMSANPIALVVIAIVALIAVFVLLWNKCEGFRDLVLGIWDKIKTVFSAVFDEIKGMIEAWLSVWIAAFGLVVRIFQAAWEGIKAVWDIVQPYFAAVWEGIKTVFFAVVDFFATIFLAAWTAIKFVWDLVQPYFQALWDAIVLVFSVVVSFFSAIFQTAWNAIKFVWDTVIGFFKLIWDGIELIFGVVADVLSGDFSGAWDGIKAIWDLVTGYFSDIWTGISGVFSPIIAWFADIFGRAWGAITGVWNAVSGYFSGIWTGITNVFSGVTQWFSDKFEAAWNTIKDWFNADNAESTFKTAIMDGLENAKEDIKTKAGEVWQAIQDAFKKAIKFFFEGEGGGSGAGRGSGYAATGGTLSPFNSARISSGFGVQRKGHKHGGVDFASPTGTPIQATTPGRVIRSTFQAGGFGNYVVIEDSSGNQHYYGHMSKKLAAVGQSAWRGKVIGYVGSTGHSTGPHLHYEVRVNGKAVNPKQWYTSARGYATGGFPGLGELFVGNENGIELMGKMGSKNVVANNMQIIEGIKAGIASGAVQAARARANAGGTNTNQEINLNQHFYKENVSPSETKRAARRGIKMGLAGGTA